MESADPDARAIRHVLDLVRDNGWEVREVEMGKRLMFTAERYGVRQIVSGALRERYLCACELARKCGIDLEG